MAPQDREIGGGIQEIAVIYRGRVQGVGFRWTARMIALAEGVAGTVKNQPDGSVALVAQGNPESLKRFLSELGSSLAGLISNKTEEMRKPTSIYRSFEILLD